MVVQTFYNGVTQPVRSIIDVAVGHTLTSKTEEETFDLIEEMTLNNYQWSNERRRPKRVGGKYDVDALTLLTVKMDAMTQKLDRLNVNVVNSYASSRSYDRCCSLDHVIENCQVVNHFAPSPVKHASYMNNFQPRPTHDPHSISYNPSWKKHPYFSYRTEPLPFP